MTDNEDLKKDFKQSASEEEWRKLGYEQVEAEKEAARETSSKAGYGDGGNNEAGFTAEGSPAAGFGAGGVESSLRFSLKEQWLMQPSHPDIRPKINAVIDATVIQKIVDNQWKTITIKSGVWGWGGVNLGVSGFVRDRIEALKGAPDNVLKKFGNPEDVRDILNAVAIDYYPTKSPQSKNTI